MKIWRGRGRVTAWWHEGYDPDEVIGGFLYFKIWHPSQTMMQSIKKKRLFFTVRPYKTMKRKTEGILK
jgi:hypothetical protein